jgi:hypothetical protein
MLYTCSTEPASESAAAPGGDGVHQLKDQGLHRDVFGSSTAETVGGLGGSVAAAGSTESGQGAQTTFEVVGYEWALSLEHLPYSPPEGILWVLVSLGWLALLMMLYSAWTARMRGPAALQPKSRCVLRDAAPPPPPDHHHHHHHHHHAWLLHYLARL